MQFPGDRLGSGVRSLFGAFSPSLLGDHPSERYSCTAPTMKTNTRHEYVGRNCQIDCGEIGLQSMIEERWRARLRLHDKFPFRGCDLLIINQLRAVILSFEYFICDLITLKLQFNEYAEHML